jgi:hypothetical protein
LGRKTHKGDKNANIFLQNRHGNEAFENHEELPRILRAIAAEITKGNTGKRVADTNGNFVGQWVIEEDEQ